MREKILKRFAEFFREGEDNRLCVIQMPVMGGSVRMTCHVSDCVLYKGYDLECETDNMIIYLPLGAMLKVSLDEMENEFYFSRGDGVEEISICFI